jgi:phage-related minor tail protein
VAISPTTGGQLPNVSSGINGRRAMGGPVSAGGAYLVGENGPEVLQMGGAGGNVVPNHALGGMVVNVTVTSADPQSVVRAIEQARRLYGSRWLNG